METYKGEPNNLDWDKSNLNYGDEFHDVVPLYTHPAKTEDEGKVCARCGAIAYDPVITYPAKPTKVKFASNSCESGWIYLDYEEPAKTLTDEELTLLTKCIEDCIATIEYRIDVERLAFKGYEHCSELESLYEESKNARQALAILRKASEK